MTNWREHKAKLMEDPEFRKAYEALGPEYQARREGILGRLEEIERDIAEAIRVVRGCGNTEGAYGVLNCDLEGNCICEDGYAYGELPGTSGWLPCLCKCHQRMTAEEEQEMAQAYAEYAKQEIRFCPCCGTALGIV